MRTEDILATPARVLTDGQRQTYFDKGYLLVESAVDSDWIERLLATTAEMVDRSRSIAESDSIFDLEPGHSSDNPRLRRLSSPTDQHSIYWEFASRSIVPDIVADLVGPNVKFHHSKLNFKWSDGGEEVKWHQDIPFYPHTNYGVLAIGLYLEDVDDEMGPMGVIPGSHKGEIYNHYNDKDQWVGALDEKDYDRVNFDDVVWLKGPAGSVTVHHCRTVHGSVPNGSPRGRPLLINAYSAADAIMITAHPYPGSLADHIVRGKPARWIDYASEPCLMPPDFSGGYSSIFAAQQEEDALLTVS